jgi:hypothetical protein
MTFLEREDISGFDQVILNNKTALAYRARIAQMQSSSFTLSIMLILDLEAPGSSISLATS